MVTHKFYEDYPVQPYISEARDLEAWEAFPERFPYGKVSRFNMTPLEEGLLPGEIVLLWRIGFNNYSNESHVVEYFEYRYGINHNASIDKLIKESYICKSRAMDTIDLITVPELKRILKTKSLAVSGKRLDIVSRVLENFSEEELAELYSLRKYILCDKGKKALAKHDDIIKKHGPKNL